MQPAVPSPMRIVLLRERGGWATSENDVDNWHEPIRVAEMLGCLKDPADVRVVEVDLSEGRARDITDDALAEYARARWAATDEWPWWLADIAPAWAMEAAE